MLRAQTEMTERISMQVGKTMCFPAISQGKYIMEGKYIKEEQREIQNRALGTPAKVQPRMSKKFILISGYYGFPS